MDRLVDEVADLHPDLFVAVAQLGLVFSHLEDPGKSSVFE